MIKKTETKGTPGGNDAFRVDDSLPRHVIRMEKVISLCRVSWKVFEAYAYLASLEVTVRRTKSMLRLCALQTDRGHSAAKSREESLLPVLRTHDELCPTHGVRGDEQYAHTK